MSTVDNFPELPPLPDDPGDFLTDFNADITSWGRARDGRLQLVLAVHDEHKYRATPLTDIKGRRFRFLSYVPRGRKPILMANGELGVQQARQRVRTRSAARAWESTKASWFTDD